MLPNVSCRMKVAKSCFRCSGVDERCVRRALSVAESAVQNSNLFKSLVALGSKTTRQLPEVHGWCTGRGDAERSDSCLVFAGSLDALDAVLNAALNTVDTVMPY